MAKRTARFAFAIIPAIAGSALLISLACATLAVAADDCLPEPTGDKPDGQHWYYRFDRAKNQRCWYLKERASNGTQVVKQAQQPSAWDFAQPAPPKAGPRRTDTAAPRSSSAASTDAPMRLRNDDDAGTAQKTAISAPATTTERAGLESPADAMAAMPSPAAQSQLLDAAMPDPGPAAATLTGDDATLDPDTNAGAPQPEAATIPPAKPSKPVAPIPMLLLVVVGALSISGLMASGLYRLGRIGQRRRRNANWQMAIARTRRARSKMRAKAKPAHVASRPTGGKKKPVRAAAPRVVAHASAPVEMAQASTTIDNRSGLAELLETRAVKSATTPADLPATARAHEVTGSGRAPANAPDHAAAIEDNLDSRGGQSAVRAFDPMTPGSSAAVALDRRVIHPDTVEELEHLLGSRAVKPANPAAYEADPSAARPSAAPTILDRAAEIENLLESAGASAVRPAAATPPANLHVASGGGQQAALEDTDPAAELIDLLESRFAPPEDRPPAAEFAAAAAQSRSDELPPWQRIPITASNDDDAALPPLDFIPRPQALRPRTRDVKQDQSLDGIQDILARLARHG
ncbi:MULTISPECIES: hypothetical protein [unclassified Bradyrhizobium]|uniref:hypothetical protein n=1 Tax=unclassified Bradyrhizobium TaxID=2631580 RepID=UPI0029168D95|nr:MULTISPECIES: hypothetical protein [unclassified Bradyrhizobium]